MSEFTGFDHIQEKQWDITEHEREEFVKSVTCISEEEHARIKNLPQHDADGSTNDDWIEARKLRVTGSASGAVAEQNPYESCHRYLEKKINPEPMDERGKRYTKWGNDNEDTCEEEFTKRYMKEKLYERTRNNGDIFLGMKIHHLGLYVCKAEGWGMLGMSPDGILETAWRKKDSEEKYYVLELCEWKCPATWESKITKNPDIYKPELLPKTFPRKHQEIMGKKLPPTTDGMRYRFPCPSYYFSQVTYGMALFRKSGVHLERAWFGVWCPKRMAVSCIPYDEVFGDWLLQRCRDVWIEEFVPMYLKNKKLQEFRKLQEPWNDEVEEDEFDDISTVFTGFQMKRRKISDE